jgi:hypothetical protein
MAKPKISSLNAEHGQKMIEVKLRFWTNAISSQKGKIIPKHAWTSGVVRIEQNPAHGIKPKSPKPFQSLLDVGAVIEKVLLEHSIVLKPSARMKKYIKE